MSILTRHPVRLVAGVISALIVAASLAACSASGTSSTNEITLYNGQHPQTTNSLVTAFEKKTGITVNVRDNDEDTFADEITTEGSHSPADVFYTENSPALQGLQDKGLLAPLDKSTLDQTAAKFRSSNGDWTGVSARVSVLIYNPSLIKKSQLPTTALALADPKYKDELAFAAGETDFQPIVTSMNKAYGSAATLKWLEALKSNAASHVYPDNETIADEVNRGAVAFGIVNEYYWYRMQAELGKSNMHSEVTHFAAGDPAYVLDVSAAGILKSSKHKAAAQKFVAFLVSKQGQQIIADSLSYEYPLDHGVVTTASETPFADLQPNPITIADLGDGSAAISLLRRAGLL